MVHTLNTMCAIELALISTTTTVHRNTFYNRTQILKHSTKAESYSGRTSPFDERDLGQFVSPEVGRLSFFKSRGQIVISSYSCWWWQPWCLCLEMILSTKPNLGRGLVWDKQPHLFKNTLLVYSPFKHTQLNVKDKSMPDLRFMLHQPP